MKLSPSDKLRIEKQFDHFCKVVIKNEMKNIHKHNLYLLKNEESLGALTQNEQSRLYCIDTYNVFNSQMKIEDYLINIENEQLFKAIQALPEKKKKIILLSYWLDMTDQEISQTLKLVRRTVCYMRTNALKQLKQYLEHISSETS